MSETKQSQRPNLFNYATSELSQDAFLCWLFSWADPKYKNTDAQLSECAGKFIKAMFNAHNNLMSQEEKAGHHHKNLDGITKIEILKQHRNIDVLCIINDEYALLVEDKTGTVNHSNQLVRYLEELGKKHDEEHIVSIYYKTEDQSRYDDVIEKKFTPFTRDEHILPVLDTYKGDNPILIDYRDSLRSISEQVGSYKTKSFEQWNGYSWVGFYRALKEKLEKEIKVDWSYVPNPSGGFLSLWWWGKDEWSDNESAQYLALHQKTLVFRTRVDDKQKRGALRSKWFEKIMEKNAELDKPLHLKRPDRFGSGNHMTFCEYDGEYRQLKNGSIDIDSTVELLKKATKLLTECHKA